MNVTGKGVVVTLKGFRSPTPQKKEPILPSVTGVSVPKMKYNKRSRNTPDDLSIINQPPPTPVGQLSIKDETEHLLPPPEPPKTPIPEETIVTDREYPPASAKTENKETSTSEAEIQATNTEMSVKITQITGDPNEKVVVYDKTQTGATDEEGFNQSGDKISNNDNTNISTGKGQATTKNNQDITAQTNDTVPESKTQPDKTDENKENDNTNSNTFLTDKEDTVDIKRVLTIPNAKMSPDSD